MASATGPMASTPKPETRSSCSISRRSSSNIPVLSPRSANASRALRPFRHASYVHLRRLDRPSADRLELVSDFTPGWRLSELLDESTAAEHPRRHHRRHRAASAAAAGGRAVWPPQPRGGDRRARRRAPDRHAAGAPGDCRARLRPGARETESRPRQAMARAAGRHAASRPACRDQSARRCAMRSASSPCRCCSAAPSTARRISGADRLALVEGCNEYRDGQPSPLSTAVWNWLKRALQFDVRTAFQAPSEAQLAFESVLASDRSYVTSSAKLEEWVAKVGAIIEMRSGRPPPSRRHYHPSRTGAGTAGDCRRTGAAARADR